MVNRFEELRYESKLSATPFISMSQLAEELGISKATVSKLEHDENYDARISIIKKYKERFPEVSYDYLLGATGTKHKQYSRVEEELPFSNEFYDNLKNVVIARVPPSDAPFDPPDEEEELDGVEYMLEAMLQQPEILGRVLNSIYIALKWIYIITHDKYYMDDLDLEYSSLTVETMNESVQHYHINRIISKYLYDYISPILEGRFERYMRSEKYKNRYKDIENIEDLVPFY